MRTRRSERAYAPPKAGRKKNASALAMVEVIVALALLSTTVIAIFGAMRSCSGASHHARMLSKSVLLAETLLAEVNLSENPVFQTKEGQQDTFWYQVRIVPTPVESLGAVYVNVKWREQQREQQYELLSLIYMRSPLTGGQ